MFVLGAESVFNHQTGTEAEDRLSQKKEPHGVRHAATGSFQLTEPHLKAFGGTTHTFSRCQKPTELVTNRR